MHANNYDTTLLALWGGEGVSMDACSTLRTTARAWLA